MPDLFHVSREVYTIGDTIPLNGDNRYWTNLMASPEKRRGNDRLESGRPADKQCRRTTHFAFDDVYHCRHFGESQYKNEKLHYYRVGMTNPTAGPMALVDVIGKADLGNAQLELLIAGYWNPNENWNFVEYLSDTMTILEVLPEPSDPWSQMTASASWDSDCILAQQVVAKIKRNAI